MRFLASAPVVVVAAFAVSGCGTRNLMRTDEHIQAQTPPRAEQTTAAVIPDLVRNPPLPPAPQARESEIRYSVVVANQPVREVLLAMARETKVNFDIHPGIEGTVNINAIDQTLRQILTRMAKQVDMRWESDGNTITVMPDTPYLHNYHVDYVNMARDTAETVGIATQVISGGVGTTGSTGTSATTGGANNSTLTITNTARHRFWETLEKNIKDLLRETDKQLPEGSSETFVQSRGQTVSATTQARAALSRATGTAVPRATTTESPGDTQTARAGDYVEQKLTFREAASVIVNPETGVITVRATSRQHEKVQEFLQQVSRSSRRQVLVEATVVEVQLSDNYQSGVDWSTLALNGLGYSISQSLGRPNLPSVQNALDTQSFTIHYNNPNAAAGGSIQSTVKLLDTFGKTRVLSSPKIMVLNNQTAVLKVVDNQVYFTLKTDSVTNQTTTTQTFTTTQNVVPVGFIMNVTPQISDADMVTFNLRPTVTRIIGSVLDPNPALAAAKVQSAVPITQTREMESVLRVASGQTAILGGLMLDSFEGVTNGLPVASRVPVLGDFFAQRNDHATKSELVIFIRPLVVHDASLDGDLSPYRRLLPDSDFFDDTRPPFPCFAKGLDRMEEWGRNPGEPCYVPPPSPATDPMKGRS